MFEQGILDLSKCFQAENTQPEWPSLGFGS